MYRDFLKKEDRLKIKKQHNKIVYKFVKYFKTANNFKLIV